MSSERFAHYWIYIFGKTNIITNIYDFLLLIDLHNLYRTDTLRHVANPTSPFRMEYIVNEMIEALSLINKK